MPALDLAVLADHLLEQATEALDAGAEPGVPGAPARRLITIGAPAFDFDSCAMLAVSVMPSVRLGQAGDQSDVGRGVACLTMTLAELRVTLIGCIPSIDDAGRSPSAAAITAASTPLLGQGWVMWCGLHNLRRSGILFPPSVPGDDRVVSIGPLTAIDAQGGALGWFVSVLVQIDLDRDLGT